MQQLENLINDISDKTIRDFIRSKNSAFKEINEDCCDIEIDNRFSDLKKLGYIDYADSDSLLVFSCKYNDDLSSRSSKKMQFEIAKNLLNDDFKDGAVFVFYDNAGRFRFSFIRKNYGDKEQKYTPWKRYTYFVDKANQTNKTFINCIGNASFTSLEKIQEGFSLESLSIEFFDKYKEIYGKFVGYITGKYYKKKSSKNWEEVDYADHEPDFIQFKKEFNSNHKQVRDYVKKLLGRLVFLKFIEKKGWLGEIKDTKEIEPNFLENVFKNSSYQDNFLDKVLGEVIFESLNNPIGNTNKCEELKKYSFPYLNGGLFEKDELDKQSIHFPKEYFEEIFAFFNQYNFTIDENDPNDAEVSVDPEMLGHIFENLLEDNKDKGAFYTPKEIVHYMCQESLIEYLCTSLSYEKDEQKDLIIELVKTKEINKGLKDNLVEIEKALEKVKICDPAIGSGAFPMGLLQEIFSIKQSIYYNIHNTLDNFPAGKEKLNIIQNNIYGVDIEQGAVDIARLRFWLSLVVDETEAKPLPNLDYKIMCGNSLISRYPLDMPLKNVFDQYNKAKKPEEKLSLRKYKDLVNSYTDTHLGKDVFKAMIEQIKATFKTSLKNKDIIDRQKKEAIVFDYEKLDLLGTRKADIDKAGYKKAKLELQKLIQAEEDVKNNKIYENSFEWRFEFPDLLDEEGNFQGFNIVIGNPPYLRIQGIRDNNILLADALCKQYSAATGSFDLYAIFTEMAIKIIKSEGIVNYIMPIKWTNSAFGLGLREIITKNNSAYKIINFGAYQVFNASTYTGIQFFKHNTNDLEYYELDRSLCSNYELGNYLGSLSKEIAVNISSSNLKSNAWVLTTGIKGDILSKIDKNQRKIKDVFEKIFQGLATSKDDVYFLYNCRIENDTVIGFSKYENREIVIEKEFVKPLLKGEDVHRYDELKAKKYVIFPYKILNHKATLYTETEINNLFPKAYEYLKTCEDTLRNREKGRLRNDEYWYRYIYPKNLISFDYEKLVAPDISLGGNFTYDDKGKYYHTTTIYGYIKKEGVIESYKFWMALLNSKLCWFYLLNTGTTLANGYFRFKPDYINPFPIPNNIENESEIVLLVDEILKQKKIDYSFDSTELENEIDRLVYQLYGLNDEEIAIVEGRV